MENLRQVLKVLAEKTCESIVLMHQPIPQRVWMRLKDSNGMKLPSHGEQCVYWEPSMYSTKDEALAAKAKDRDPCRVSISGVNNPGRAEKYSGTSARVSFS